VRPRQKIKEQAIAIAAFVGLGAIGFPQPARSAARPPSVELAITLPSGTATRVIVPDGEGATIRLPNRTAYGFVPKIRGEDKSAVVVVGIWAVDETPNRHLGEVEAVPGGPTVTSDTAPPFSLRVIRLIKRK
jgi:hypothetical protein